MRISLKRRTEPESGVRPELVEVVTPRTNAATITAAENLLAALTESASGGRWEPFSLELAATHQSRRFLARSLAPDRRRSLEEQIGVAYPQAALRQLDVEHFPGLDPARPQPGEQVAACALNLSGPPYLPLRTFLDQEVTAETQADPVLGLLGALSDLPEGWRAVSQLVCLRPSPKDWHQPYLRLTIEHPLAAERAMTGDETSLTSVFLMGGLLVLGTVAFQAYQWYDAGAWLPLSLLGVGALTGFPALCWFLRKLRERPLYDPRLVQDKLSRGALVSQLRLAVFAPQKAAAGDVQTRLSRLASAYRQFTLPAGNSLTPQALRLQASGLRGFDPLLSNGAAMVLNTRELAGLWHLPHARADVPLLERTTARRYSPLPASVAHGCPIGISAYQGRTIPVALPPELLRRHLLLVAKTRRGKSSLLLQFACFLMGDSRRVGAASQSLVVVDPHGDLAQATLGLIPPNRHNDVVYLDLAQRERPFGLNLLDAGLGWDRDQAVGNALAIFRREYDQFWGPRMEDAFRFALLTLVEANLAICAKGPEGRSRQHTILEIPAVLSNPVFRRQALTLVTDPVVHHWWSGYFDALDRRLQVEIINPVQTKVQRFSGSRAARAVVGQPRSTIDPADWLRSGAIVIINTAKGIVGEDTAALVGGTLLNLAALAVAQQAVLLPAQRRQVTLLVDEFQTMPGADYETMLAELSKYGANLMLATQSLARLEALDREHQRALRATVFANLDGLFVFNSSAEDAEYLVRELGDQVDQQDLVALGDYQCYARLSSAGERLPVFWTQLASPPTSDSALQQLLASASAARYGRAAAQVEQELATVVQRLDQFRLDRSGPQSGVLVPHPGERTLTARAGGTNEQVELAQPPRPRNEHRQPRKRRSPQQGELIPAEDPGHAAGQEQVSSDRVGDPPPERLEDEDGAAT